MSKEHDPVYASPEECEAAFYAAFERFDTAAMMTVWAERAPLLCIHPAGPALTSREVVAESWKQIFRGAGRVKFTLSDHRVVQGPDVAMRFVHENIHHGPDLAGLSVVLATNVYVREGDGWRMCTHHASPAPAPRARARAAPVH